MTALSKMAEELARGLFNCLSRDRYLTEKEHDRIVAALREYGAVVRARDRKIIEDLVLGWAKSLPLTVREPISFPVEMRHSRALP